MTTTAKPVEGAEGQMITSCGLVLDVNVIDYRIVICPQPNGIIVCIFPDGTTGLFGKYVQLTRWAAFKTSLRLLAALFGWEP